MTQRRMVGSLVSALVVLAACGGAADTVGEPDAPAAPTTEPSPFVFDASTIPTEFEAVAAGSGPIGLEWGSDTTGSTEPFVLLGRPGEPGDLVVSLTGYAGYEGGLSQASLAYSNPDSFEELDVGGQLAHFTNHPVGTVPGSFAQADLVVRHDDETAIRVVSSFDATFDELAAIVPLVEVPDERGQPPTLSELPDGREVEGSMSSDAVQAFNISPGLDGNVGTASVHSVGLVRNDDGPFAEPETIQIVTLPGAAGDLAALAGFEASGFGNVTATATQVDDRDAMSVAHGGGGFEQRSLFTTTPDGDLLVVGSEGPKALTTAELAAIAASVAATDQASWDAFVEKVYGGPGLHPDEGHVELARGQADGLEWLAQTGDVVDPIPAIPAGEPTLDECLKLSNHRRACARGTTGSESGEIRTARAQDATDFSPFTFPPFAQVITTSPGESILLTTDDGIVVAADLVAIPDTDQRVAVMMLGRDVMTGITTCQPFPAPGEFGDLRYSRVEVLDEAGAPIACVGLG